PEFYGSTIIFEFLAGSIIAGLIQPRMSLSSSVAAPGLLIAIAWLIAADWLQLGVPRPLRLGIPAALIVPFPLTLAKKRAVRFLHLPDALGNASYSIYLTHIFIIAAMRVVGMKLGLFQVDGIAIPIVVAELLLGAGVGLIVHAFYEKPVIKFVNGLFRPR